MVIPLDDTSFVLGKNQSVLCNTSNPESTLKNNTNSIEFHHVHDGVSRDEWRTAYVNTDEKLTNLFTKLLSGEKRWKYLLMLLHHL